MYQQAVILSNGHPEQLTLCELSPNWSSDKMMGSKVNVDCNILSHDLSLCWIACIDKIYNKYSTETTIAPNYLQGLGGTTTTIQRLIDLDMSDSCIYHPKAINGKTAAVIHKFPPFDLQFN